MKTLKWTSLNWHFTTPEPVTLYITLFSFIARKTVCNISLGDFEEVTERFPWLGRIFNVLLFFECGLITLEALILLLWEFGRGVLREIERLFGVANLGLLVLFNTLALILLKWLESWDTLSPLSYGKLLPGRLTEEYLLRRAYEGVKISSIENSGSGGWGDIVLFSNFFTLFSFSSLVSLKFLGSI